jgi:Skp family chaperone for outer membrane proteins
VIGHRLAVTGLCLLAAATLIGCRPQGASAPVPTATPAPAAAATPSVPRIGVVDFKAAARAHRRWAELEAIGKKVELLQFRLQNPPPPPDVPAAQPSVNLEEEANRLRAALHAELDALQAQKQREIEAHVNDLRAEHESRLAERQRELNAELQKTIEAKRDELQRELDKFELATMAEYRVPLANIRVKDAVPPRSEEEARRLGEEAQRIQKERDEKIRAKAETLEKSLLEYQQAKTAEAEAKFKASVEAAEQDIKTKAAAKEAEATAEVQQAVQEREAAFKKAMEERQKLVRTGTDEQLRAAQERYVRQVQADAARIRTELQALEEQRLRLQDTMFAEIKIEVAAVAQEQHVDVVLTNTVGQRGAIDLTSAVVARLRRS